MPATGHLVPVAGGAEIALHYERLPRRPRFRVGDALPLLPTGQRYAAMRLSDWLAARTGPVILPFKGRPEDRVPLPGGRNPDGGIGRRRRQPCDRRQVALVARRTDRDPRRRRGGQPLPVARARRPCRLETRMTRTFSLRAVRRPVPAVACLPAIATPIMTAVLAAIATASGAAALDAVSPPPSAVPLPGLRSAGAPSAGAASGSAAGKAKPARSARGNSIPANSIPANSVQAPSVPARTPSAGAPNAGAGSRLLRMLGGGAPGQPPPAGSPERSKTAGQPTRNSTTPDPAGAASVIEGCPRAVLTRLLAGAARREDALSALAIEHETLKLCRERQTIVTGIFETEARLRALRAPAEPAAVTGNWSPVPTVPTVPAALPQLRPPPARPAPKPATPAPAPPRYGWFSIVGMAGALRAGVTDGRRVWFVREGDPLGAWAYWRQEMAGAPIGGKIWRLVADGAVDPFDALLKGAGTEHEAAASLTVVAEPVR